MRARLYSRRGGFTMVELLVVVGIIALLMSIGLPIIFALRRNADVARMRLDLRTVEVGLEEYKKVFHDYPRQGDPSKSGSSRERVLVLYLLGPYAQGIQAIPG